MIYLDEATQEWADADTGNTVHKDSNGHVLEAGDTVKKRIYCVFMG